MSHHQDAGFTREASKAILNSEKLFMEGTLREGRTYSPLKPTAKLVLVSKLHSK